MASGKRVHFATEAGDEPSDNALLSISRKQARVADQGDDQDTSVHEEASSTRADYEGKHTLDSDEEEEEKHERLDVRKVEGQEAATIEFDEEIKITPFNMEEEEEEGHFDTFGSFVFNKKGDQIQDAWLDGIDWAKVKKDAGAHWHKEQKDDESQQLPSDMLASPYNKADAYKCILEIVHQGETITRALKRLGGSKTNAERRKARWEKEKENPPSSDAGKRDDDNDQENLLKLTELVDRLVSEGEFEAYGYTHEKMKFELEKMMPESVGGKDDAVPELDIFSDDIEQKTLEKPTSAVKATTAEADSTTSGQDIQWVFRWENKDDAPLYGPYSNEQMQQWVDGEFFKEGVWVRRADQGDGPFYSSRRVDFELYM